MVHDSLHAEHPGRCKKERCCSQRQFLSRYTCTGITDCLFTRLVTLAQMNWQDLKGQRSSSLWCMEDIFSPTSGIHKSDEVMTFYIQQFKGQLHCDIIMFRTTHLRAIFQSRSSGTWDCEHISSNSTWIGDINLGCPPCYCADCIDPLCCRGWRCVCSVHV